MVRGRGVRACFIVQKDIVPFLASKTSRCGSRYMRHQLRKVFTRFGEVCYDGPMTPHLLTIEGLHVSYSTREGDVPAIVDVSLSMQQGECIGLVGESGCGKTTVALAIMRYLGANGCIGGGCIRFKGR